MNKFIGDMTLKERSKTISYVPQFTTSNFPHSVFYTVLMGRKPYIGYNYSGEDKEKTLEILSKMNLVDLSERSFTNLSGGERQKTILARAMIQECPVMLLDEPTSNLDLRHKHEFMEILRNIVGDEKVSVLIAVHDLNLAARFCDKILLLDKGEKMTEGIPKQVLTRENIEKVYGVSVEIIEHNGIPTIIH